MRLWLAVLLCTLTACSSSAPEPQPNSGNPPRDSYGEWLKIQLPDTFCSDGSQYKFFVNYSESSDNLVVAFEPGGACWEYESCSPNGGIRGAANPNGINDNHAVLWQLAMPAISRVHGDSSLHDYNFVFLPYCTGDVFAGDQVATYKDPKGSGDDIVFHHAGHRNMLAVIDWLGEAFRRVPKMLVTGISAGGVGSLVNYYFLRRGIPGVERGYLLDDSGPFFPNSTHSAPLYQKVRNSWNADNWIHDDLPAGFDVNDFGSINTALADEFPDDRLAHAYFMRDYNFSLYSYETFYDFPPKETIMSMWADDTAKLIEQVNSRKNLAAFIPYYRNINCSHGTMLVQYDGTEIESAGMNIGDFIELLLDDEKPLETFVEETQPDEDLAPSPDCEMVPSQP